MSSTHMCSKDHSSGFSVMKRSTPSCLPLGLLFNGFRRSEINGRFAIFGFRLVRKLAIGGDHYCDSFSYYISQHLTLNEKPLPHSSFRTLRPLSVFDSLLFLLSKIMADTSARTSSTEVAAAWERFYHLLGRGYAHIAENPHDEAEILGLFRGLDTASLEGTTLGREYSTFPRLFINSLRAYRRDHETVTLTRIVEARYQDQSEHMELTGLVAENQKRTIRFAEEQVLFLIREREKLVDRLAMLQTYFEHDSSDILMRFKCDWLQERIEYLTVDIAFERSVIRGLETAAEHYEAYVTRLREKCGRLFFRLADLDSQNVRCKQSITCLESQLNSFVMLIRAHFGFTFPPQ